jgi:Tfp pilus assembly protein PilN
MRRLPAVRLDHAGAEQPWLRWPLALLAGVACVCAMLAYQAIDLMGTAARLDAQVEAAQGRRQAARAHSRPRPTPQSLAEQRALAQLREATAKPWERLFSAIERASGPDVSLLTLAPQAAGTELTLSGEARSMAALLAFMRQLQKAGFFNRVYLHDHHVDPADAMHPVRFSLLLKWGTS